MTTPTDRDRAAIEAEYLAGDISYREYRRALTALAAERRSPPMPGRTPSGKLIARSGRVSLPPEWEHDDD